jgi:hypothetical protein
MATALAGVMILLLLWGIHRCPLQDVIAQSLSLQQTQPSTAPDSPAWAPDQVFTQRYTSTEIVVWPIPSCNIVITFPKNLIGSDATHLSVVFTFTTESKQTFPSPLQSIDYFFSLDGSTPKVLPSSLDQAAVQPQGPPSFNEGKSPTFEWHYQDADLSSIQESSLRLYREWGIFGNQDWKEQNGWVDAEHNKAYFDLEQLDDFGFGGYRAQLYFPLNLNAMTGQ